MALTITNSPTYIAMAIQPVIVELYNSSYASFTKYRYVLDISINGTLVDRKKLLPNAAGYGIFEISSTIQSYLGSTYQTYSAVGFQDISNVCQDPDVAGSTTCSRNENDVVYVEVEAREEYVVAGVVTLSGVISSIDFYSIGIVSEFINGVNYLNPALYGNDEAVTKQFLTNAPNVVYCPADGWGTIAYVNYYNGTLADNRIVEIKFKGYDEDFTFNGEDYSFCDACLYDLDAAGIPKGINGISVAAYDQALLYIPFGWRNFDTDENLTGTFVDASYVTVTTVAANGDVMTSPFLGVTPCSAFDNVRIRFKNAYGVWDYFDFNYISRKTEQLEKKTFRKLVGNWAGSTYSYGTYEREKTQYGTTGTQTLLVNSRILTEAEYNWLAELVRSDEVHVYLDGLWQAVNVIENNYEFKTDIVDRAKKQLGLKLEFANPLRLAL